MATLIPAIGSCVSRMTQGERRMAERLEQKLEDDYLLWYDVPVGPSQTHPDFVILHPRRGLLILEVKDWRLDTVQSASREEWQILVDGALKTVTSPMAQARHCAHQVVRAMEKDPQLVHADGPHKGKLAFPWSYGAVFSHITRKQFAAAELENAIEPHRVICADEMTEAVEPEAFQERLWHMFAHHFGHKALGMPQIERVRWIMFPEVRVPVQGALFEADAQAELPSIMRVMDLQQEQLARSLGEGHRVIHGVAGSGKTMILGYRAEQLAKAQTASTRPILILCYNEPLAKKLASIMQAKGIAHQVHAVHFHKWCYHQLVAYGQSLPPQGTPKSEFVAQLVQRVIAGVDRHQIPSGQYQAVLIDEGHDFAPAWLKLVVQMVDPSTNSLLVLYDDAQSIYERSRTREGSKQFSFKSVGIQAQGRTTILKINYRNTRQILQTASLVAADLLTPQDKDEDGVPLLRPVGCGRSGEAPLIIRLPSLRDEANKIAELLSAAHREGHAWGDMAILCRHWDEMDACAAALSYRRLPHQVRKGSGTYNPAANSIKVMTMHVSKGLEFPVVALVGAGHMPADGTDEREEARLFYVGATRATQRLIVGAGGEGRFAQVLSANAVGLVENL
jgi:UvrD-like helicase C-terminal domain/Nuclease-related domain/AAA domain